MVSERRCCIANPLINLLHLAAAQPGKMEGADKEAWTWIPARPHASGLKMHDGPGAPRPRRPSLRRYADATLAFLSKRGV